MPLTDDELKQIRERAAKASPGPWLNTAFAYQSNETKLLMAVRSETDWDWGGWVRCRTPENATFIAHAREDVPRLLDEVDRLVLRVAELEVELIEFRETIVYSEGVHIKDGKFTGWYDSSANSDVVHAGDELVTAGLWERHPDGHGRRQFYRRKEVKLRDDHELDCTDAAHPAWWRGTDHAFATMCAEVSAILDGKEIAGVCNEPWESIRRRIASLRDELAVTPPTLEWLKSILGEPSYQNSNGYADFEAFGIVFDRYRCFLDGIPANRAAVLAAVAKAKGEP